MRLDHSSIEIIKEILSAREISINDLCENLSISRRTFYYRLDKINDWLRESGFGEVHNRRSHGVALAEAEKPAIQELLASMAASIYELSSEERHVNILLCLATTRDDVFINTINTLNKVSRNTTLEDLHRLGLEIHRLAGVEIRFRKKSGYFIEGETLSKRLCLFGLLQRNLKYKNNFLEGAVLRVLDGNAERIGRTGKELHLLIAEIVRSVQEDLDRQFTDKDRRLLRYALALFCVDVATGSTVTFDASQRSYLSDTQEYAAARRIRHTLEAEIGRTIDPSEDCFLALLLLVVKSHALTPGATGADKRLVDTIAAMIEEFQKVSGVTCHDNATLVTQLFSHLRPAIHRCLFSIHLDNVLRDDIARKYPRLLEPTRSAVGVLERAYGIRLSDDELGYIAILFGARLTPEARQAERRILLVTEGGISTTTLLERQLRELSILPIDLETCSVSEFLSGRPLADPDLIVTTADLPVGSHRDIPVLKVRLILSASERHVLRGLIEGPHGALRTKPPPATETGGGTVGEPAASCGSRNPHLAGPVRTIHARLRGLDLRTAESVLEAARRIVWTAAFCADDPAIVARTLEVSEPGAGIGMELAAHSLRDAEDMLRELRFMLYADAFGSPPRPRVDTPSAAQASDDESPSGIVMPGL